MVRRALAGFAVAVAWTASLAGPVWAHGDHDARPLARHVQAGPYVISLWQVYPDAGAAMTPHLIVMFDGGGAVPAVADVTVAVDSKPTEVVPSSTTANGLETTNGVTEGDIVTLTVSDGSRAWDIDPVIVPPQPTSMLPMPELIYTSIALTLGTAVWVARRTTRAWTRPVARPV